MAFGSYTGSLGEDDVNMALRNSGSSYQLSAPQLGASAPGGAQYAGSGSMAGGNATGYSSGPGSYAGVAQGIRDQGRSPQEKKEKGGLENVLGLVGKVLAFL